MKVCFFASVSDRTQLPRTFYGRDIELLEEIGYQVSVATRMRDISPRCDLVFGWWFGSGVRAVLTARFLRRPCVIVGVVDGAEIAARRRLHEHFLIDYCLKHADSAVVLSQHDLDALSAKPTRSIHLVRPGLPFAPHRPPLAERDPIVLAIGSVGMGPGSRKRLDNLVRAIALVHPRLPHLSFHFAGAAGPGYPDLCGLIQALGLSQCIRMHGRVSFAARDELYRRALMLVHPVVYEDLAIAPLEAMSQGLPVITARRDLTWEVADASAQYCDSSSPDEIADRILALASDSALWERCSVGGYDRVRQSYSREHRRARLQQVIDITMAAYREPLVTHQAQSTRS